ncbi:hypothetical protein MMC18_002873 [Xylographa bjoerkii]|nr:hypothetical protein [Xylographa bjoerkii]
MSEKGVVELIQAMPALQEFYAHRSIRSIWSIEVFLAIGMHQILGSLELPNIPDHWISILTDQYEGRFARLVSLSTGLSEAGLEMLVPHLPEVTVLSLSMVGSSHRVLRTIATSFPDLSYLNLVLRSDDVIREQDLILLADNSPSLSGLGLFSEEADSMIRANIGSDGITNATINDLARRVPKLRNLSLYLGDAALTEQSLVFLGAHCKMLGTIYISADVDFETLVGDDHRNWFPELHQLDILPPPSDRRRYAHPDRVARQLREAAPKLRGLIVGFSNLDPSEAVLKDMFDGLVRGG